MIEASETAQRFVVGRERGDLDTDDMLLFALVRAVEIIGEAAARLSEGTRLMSAAVPWAAIVAMRNRLIHACFDIDRDILWKTVSEEIPVLLLQLRPLVAGK